MFINNLIFVFKIEIVRILTEKVEMQITLVWSLHIVSMFWTAEF